MLKIELLRPSALADNERAEWSSMLDDQTDLQRAFFAPGFAAACEAAHGRARVAVLHEGGRIEGFFPFQFRTPWHACLGLAERIGGNLADHAGVVARPGLRLSPAALLRGCRLGALFLTHLSEPQEAFGLTAAEWRIGHRIDVPDGAEAYFTQLVAGRKSFVQDTERRLRRAERDYGPVTFAIDERPSWADVSDLITAKRDQYRRTGATDGFVDTARLRLLEALLAAPGPECRAVLTRLTAGEHVLARHLGLMCRGTLSYWFPVYDPAAQKVSPGRLLLWHTLKRADALGIRLIDRGEGDTEAKRDFSTGTSRYGVANWTAGTWRTGLTRLWQAAEWRLARRAATAAAAPAEG